MRSETGAGVGIVVFERSLGRRQGEVAQLVHLGLEVAELLAVAPQDEAASRAPVERVDPDHARTEEERRAQGLPQREGEATARKSTVTSSPLDAARRQAR